MHRDELQALQEQMPAGWTLRQVVRQVQPASGTIPPTYTADAVTIQAVSDRFALILEGPFHWILKRAVSYSLSAKA